MKQIKEAIQQMITISEEELNNFLCNSVVKTFKKNEIIGFPNVIPNEVYFINKGILRVLIHDNAGVEHTIYFAIENQFIADYANFLLKQSSLTSIQALEETELVVIPRSSIEWGYAHLKQGEKLGRIIAEFYFIYQDDKIKNQYARTPTERYNTLSTIFPNIHNRVPQHMIASYLGISPVHLSRLKKLEISKT